MQLGADYSIGVRSTNRVALGPIATSFLVNASSPSEIIFSNSSTQLAENLARALEAKISSQDEFITTLEHETNVGPWHRLAQRTKCKAHLWRPSILEANNGREENKYAVGYDIKNLIPLLNAKTRLVAISACSNILGHFTDVKEVVKTIRQVVQEKSGGQGKVEVVVDCVAYAPHRRIDVQDWDVDYAFFSYYKVYGPHCAAMYIRQSSMQNSLQSIAHYFINDPANQFQLGGPGYELTYSISWVLQYLMAISRPSLDQGVSPEKLLGSKDMENALPILDSSFSLIESHESLLVQRLLSFLTSQRQWDRGIRIVGSDKPDRRAPTISFVVTVGKNGEPAMRSRDVVNAVDKLGGIGIRFGHFYAARLIDALGLPPDDGVIRVSLVHYNTLDEVDRIIKALQSVILTE